MHPLWVAKTGLDAQNTRMTVISNNLANANTPGFKRGRVAFEDLLYQTVRQPGGKTSEDTESPSGQMIGTGVRVVATEQMHTQGGSLDTGNPLDLMIQGRGFFEILLPDGDMAYTRSGSFQVDSEGRIVTASGYELQPGLNVPDGAESISVSTDGVVEAKLAGQAQPISIGTIQTADFINPAGLQPIGKNLFVETNASGAPQLGTPSLDGLGSLAQGALETSNVNVVEELVSMIETQRAYEMNSRAISSADEMLRFLSNNV